MTKVEKAVKECHELLTKAGLKFIVIADDPNGKDFRVTIDSSTDELASWLYEICSDCEPFKAALFSVVRELLKEE